MTIIKGFFMAWGCFCRVPCPWKVWDENARKYMLVMLPVVGLLMGLAWFGIAFAIVWLGLPAPIGAAILTIYPFLVTGFIHLDGFMDCSDAICSRAPLEKKLQILKDSHVGAFAVIWAIVLFLFFFAGMWTLLSGGASMCVLILIPMASRTVSVANVMGRKPLGTSQYSVMGQGSSATGGIVAVIVLLAVAVGLFALFACDSYRSLIVIAVCLVGSLIAVANGVKQLGGMSGDISGYGITWGELAAVVAAACIL